MNRETKDREIVMDYKRWSLLFGVLFIGSCSSEDTSTTPPPSEKQTFNLFFDFSEDSEEFEINVADYFVEHERNGEIISTLSQLPEPYEYRMGIEFSWYNYSDDIKGYIKKKFSDLKPDTTYSVDFQVDILTVESEQCVGGGGGPGSSVYVKASLLPREPARFISYEDSPDGTYRVDIDDGQSGGSDVVLLGDIGLPISCETSEESPVWEIKSLVNDESFVMTTEKSGEAWIYASIDSGFEGETTVYITDIEVTILEQ